MSSVEHNGVMCDGPLCKDKYENIQGIRFKCSWCENVDFCSACIASFHNNHDATHAFIRCLLPTQFHIIKEIDSDSKQLYLESCGDPLLTIDDVFCRTCVVDTSGPLRRSPMPKSFHLPFVSVLPQLLPEPSFHRM